jgi:nucleoside-diphosphate-sugar epimerase
VIVGSGDNALPFVYVSDVVRGILLALDTDHAVGQAYNISSDAPLTQREFLAAIARHLGAKPPRLHVPYHALYAVGSAAETVAAVTRSQRKPVVTKLGVKLFGTDNRHSISKARRDLGYEPLVHLEDGIRRAAAWYSADGEPAPRSRSLAQAGVAA